MFNQFIKLGVTFAGISTCSAEESYNILAVDGGGIRGLIPGVVLQKMENFAFAYSNEKGYIASTEEEIAEPKKFRKIGTQYVNELEKAIHMS